MQDDIIQKGDVNTDKVILWGNSNKIKRLIWINYIIYYSEGF
jgi:hypothetical protein